MPGGPATRGPGMPVVAKPGKRFQLDNGTFAIFDPGNNVVGWVHSTDLNGPREEFWAFTPSYMKPRCSISPDLPTGISIRCTPETMGLTYAQFRDYAMQHGATTFSKTMPVDLSQLP